MSDDYKKMLLDRTKLKSLCDQFCAEKDYSLDSFDELADRNRIVFTRSDGEIPATVDLLLNNDGSTTAHYKMGKNQEVGLELAVFLKGSIDAHEPDVVNLLLKNFTKEKFDSLTEFLQNSEDEQKNKEFEVTDVSNVSYCTKLKVRSNNHSDTLSITHYHTKNKLQLQGKPLYTYRQTAYILAEDLDFNGLCSVVYKQDMSEESIKINYNDIETELNEHIPDAYHQLDEKLINMLKSCYALRSLNIDLPDYGLMVFPALRVLEATIRKLFTNFRITAGHKIGSHFKRNSNSTFSVKPKTKSSITCSKTITALENCYTFYHKQRHQLFHTSDFPDASYVIEDKTRALNLIEGTLKLINRTYKNVSFS